MTYEPPTIYRVRYLVCPECGCRDKAVRAAGDPWMGKLCEKCKARGSNVKLRVETSKKPRS